MNVLDDYLVDPRLSLLDKTKIQAQVLVPVLRALRAELGKETADALVRQALRDWSKQLFAAVGESIQGSKRRKWAAMAVLVSGVCGLRVEPETVSWLPTSLLRGNSALRSPRVATRTRWPKRARASILGRVTSPPTMSTTRSTPRPAVTSRARIASDRRRAELIAGDRAWLPGKGWGGLMTRVE